MSNRKGGIRTQTTAAASRRLRGSAEDAKSVIHPAARRGNTLSLQGSGGQRPLQHPCWGPFTRHHGANGTYPDAKTPHVPKACRKRQSPGLLWRDREDYLMKCMG